MRVCIFREVPVLDACFPIPEWEEWVQAIQMFLPL